MCMRPPLENDQKMDASVGVTESGGPEKNGMGCVS